MGRNETMQRISKIVINQVCRPRANTSTVIHTGYGLHNVRLVSYATQTFVILTFIIATSFKNPPEKTKALTDCEPPGARDRCALRLVQPCLA